MEEIKAVLKANDIAGFVVLHDPAGFVEYLNHINPSYSCAQLNDGKFIAKLKASELPGGKVQAKKIAEDTFNMVSLMTDMITMNASGYIDFYEMLKGHWGGTDDGPTDHTSHQQQNN